MIGTVVRVGLLRMWHGRTEILLTFVVPIAFFTIFAFIFDEQIGLGKSPKVDLALVDEDGTDLSHGLLAALAEEEMLRVYSPDGATESPHVFETVDPARDLVLSGGLSLAVVVPEGWAASLTGSDRAPVSVQLLADSSDPVATQVVTALIEQLTGRTLAERARSHIESVLSLAGQPGAASAAARFTKPVGVDVVDLFSADKANPVVSMDAAGLAGLFLLFGAVGNAGSLLEEEESQNQLQEGETPCHRRTTLPKDDTTRMVSASPLVMPRVWLAIRHRPKGPKRSLASSRPRERPRATP